MKKYTKLLGLITLMHVFMGLNAQNINVSGALVGNGTYPTLGAAFTAINGGSQTGANIIVDVVGNTTETSSAVLNSGTWTSLNIAPSGGALRTVSGVLAASLIDLNGATNVSINGLNTGGNALTFSNTDIGNLTTSTVRFINGASSNTITNCTVLGASTSNTLGTILFSIGTTAGNSNNSISNTTITAVSSLNLATNMIYSAGTLGFENNNNQIINCIISDFFNAGAVCNGIQIQSNSSGWTLSNNRIFQTATRTFTTSNTHNGINIVAGSGYTVSNNYIGASAANATGTMVLGGTIATRFIGISVNTPNTGSATSVFNNTVSAITLSTSSGAATSNGILCGINFISGNGSINNNIIGGNTGVNLLQGFPTTSQGALVGINASTTGTISINSNTIGGLSSSGVTAAVAGAIFGINISGATGSLSINTNIIGNSTTNNMRSGTSGLTTGNSLCVGINFASAPVGTVITSGNTIQNFASFGTGFGGTLRGIFTTGTGGATTFSVVNNKITNLVTDNANVTQGNGQLGTLGIGITYGTSNTIASNTISGIAMTGTVAASVCMAGISTAAASNPLIQSNLIFDLSNAATGTIVTAPGLVIGVYIRGANTGSVIISNNMISLGTGQTANTSFVGVGVFSGGVTPVLTGIYYNTINITGVAASGAQPSFGIYRGNFLATAVTFPVDIRNNLITNTRSGGTGVHCAISNNFGATTASNAGWGANASNNNVLNAANPANVGWWNTAQTFASWQTTSVADANSYSGIAVTYVNPANDLHLNMGLTPTLIESNGQTIAGISTDIDNQVRPGPVGSVNGGAFLPDIGADEIDAVPLDINAPNISLPLLTFTCSTADRTFTTTLLDLSGVPTTGTLQPRVYFRKNAGPWFSTQGALVSGSATNGVWSFTISSAAMGGLAVSDVVGYYVIAQDILGNIGSNPSAGLVATNVNAVTTPPTTPNTYLISGNLSGLYTVGAAGTYSTLTAAANAYNNSCLTGPVVFSLIDATYPSETFPITFISNVNASSTNSLVIKPAAGVSPTITGSSTTAIIVINGGDFITINGSNGTTANSICPLVKASRDLSIINTNASTASAVLSIQTNTAGNAATNNAILNSIVTGNGGLTTGVAINISGPTIGSGAGAVNNDNNSIINNLIQSAQIGVFSAGQSITIKNNNTTVDLNELNGVGANAIGRVGIMILFDNATLVRANTIANIISAGSVDVMGITLGSNALANSLTTGAEVTNATVTGNVINNISQSGTYSSGGIVLAATTTGTSLIANNSVNNLYANGTGGDFGVGIYYGGGTGVLNVFHNSVQLTGTLTGASQPNIALGINGVTPPVNIRNNILICTGSNGFNGNTGIGLAYTSTLGNYANLISSNNAIFVSGASSSIGRVGSLAAGTQQVTLANWQTETGKDLNSVNISPTFVSANDLHLVANSNTGIENAGTPIAAVPTDVDCDVRNTTAPDMGFDEVCTNPSLATAAVSNSLVCAGSTVALSVVTGTLNDATAWNWYSGSCGGSSAGTGTSVNVAPTNTTSYFVSGMGGCITTPTCASVTVNTNPLPTLTANSGSICAGNSFTIVPSGASTYTFSGGSAIVSPIATTNYTVSGTSTLGCNGSAIATVTVNALPTLTVSTSATLICTGQTASLTASGANTYSWSAGGNTAAITVSPSTTTIYTVNGTNALGCVSLPVSITQSVSLCVGLSTPQANALTVSLYPNPSTGLVNLELNAPSQVSVSNVLGELMWQFNTESSITPIDLSKYSNGLYFVTIKQNNQSQTIRVVKQ